MGLHHTFWLRPNCALFLWGIAGARPPPPPERPGPREFIEEKREEAIEFLEKYMEPERLERLKDKQPRLYRHALREALEQKHRLERLKEIDPERYELSEKILRLEIETKNLAFGYREMESKKELKRILPELFDLKEKDKAFELKRLEKKIDKLKNIISERKEAQS